MIKERISLKNPSILIPEARTYLSEFVFFFLSIQIGNEFIRGVSGGERKRTNIGMELIIAPRLLFLDEPTTGLDAYTAVSVVQLLKRFVSSSLFSDKMLRYSILLLFFFLLQKLLLLLFFCVLTARTFIKFHYSTTNCKNLKGIKQHKSTQDNTV